MINYPPIKFECQVRGKKLVAEVNAQVAGTDRFLFRTRFSDGFEDTFSHDTHGDQWGALNDAKQEYLKRVKDDLAALQNYQPFRHYLYFRDKQGHQSLNIWVFETMPENGVDVYSVYYMGQYQFDMKKLRGAWLAKSVRNNAAPIDTSTIEQIGQMIDARINDMYTAQSENIKVH